MTPQRKKYSFVYRNGLLLVFSGLLLVALVGQIFTGKSEYNAELEEYHQPAVSLGAYLQSGHFILDFWKNPVLLHHCTDTIIQ